MNRLMTVREVAYELHVHVQTVKRIDPADLPFFRVTRRGDRRYDPRDVALYLKEMTRPK